MKRITDPPPLPLRPAAGHKGTFGHALVIAGSRGMSGAAILSGMGALRAGAGLVSLAVPDEIVSVVSAVNPSYLTLPQPTDRNGRIAFRANSSLRNRAADVTATAIGPGLGQSASLQSLVAGLYHELGTSLVIDADGLNNLADTPALSEKPSAPRILTPHPGEFARLTGMTVRDIQKQREQIAGEFARAQGVILVLKGQGTVVTDGNKVYVNESGNSGMATGGSGDVLTGITVSLLAQRVAPFDAACLGVYLHGLAGDLAVAELSQPGLIASDLPEYLAEVLLQLTEGNEDE